MRVHASHLALMDNGILHHWPDGTHNNTVSPTQTHPTPLNTLGLLGIHLHQDGLIHILHSFVQEGLNNEYICFIWLCKLLYWMQLYKRLGSCAFDQIIALVTSFLLFHSYHSWKYRNEWSSTCRAAWSSTATASPKYPLEPYEVRTNWVIGGLSQRVPPSCVPDGMF